MLEARNGSIPATASDLRVGHVTLWRYLKKHAPDKVSHRREKAHVDDMPLEVCILVYRAIRLEGKDFNVVRDQYNVSRKVLQAMIKRGRDAVQRSAGERSSGA